MSDTISYIYDLYEDYKELCKTKAIEPININSEWYIHFIELTSKPEDYE
jgi:hypothetical protein